MGRWTWSGRLPLEPVDMPESLKLSERNWPTVTEIQVADGRAYVEIQALGKRYDWFVMDLEGLETPGAPNGSEWVQVTLGGNIFPRFRNTEHFPKDLEEIHPGYIAEKFPGLREEEHKMVALFVIPFLVRVLRMDPL